MIDPDLRPMTELDRRRLPRLLLSRLPPLPLYAGSAPYHYIAHLGWVYEEFTFNVYCYMNRYLVPAETIEAVGNLEEFTPITVRGSLDPLQSGEWQSLRITESGTTLGLDVSLRDCEIIQ